MIINKGNYCFLGVSVAYIICACIQWRIEGVLPAWLYLLIAFTSLTISIFELIKDLIEGLIWFSNSYINLRKHADSLAQKHIQLYSHNPSLEPEMQEFQRMLIDEDGRRSIKQNTKRIQTANKLQNIVSCIEIVFVTIMIIMSPLKVIPYDAVTMKCINVVTIFTFGVMFLSLFFKNMIEEEKAYTKAVLYHEDISTSYYLNILKKIKADQ